VVVVVVVVVVAAVAAAVVADLITGGAWFEYWLCHQLSWHVHIVHGFPQPLKVNSETVPSTKQFLPPSGSTPTYYS
jgi:hypothetical protein